MQLPAIKHWNGAIATVRRQEQRRLLEDVQEDSESLTDTSQLWLYAQCNVSKGQHASLVQIKRLDLEVARGLGPTRELHGLLDLKTHLGDRAKSLNGFDYAANGQLASVTTLAKVYHRHVEKLLTCCPHKITSADSERLGSRLQSIKLADRGFLQFAKYRMRIRCYCGKLELAPRVSTHEDSCRA